MKIAIITSEYGEAGGGLSLSCIRFKELLEADLGHKVSIISSVSRPIKFIEGGYNSSLGSSIGKEYKLKTDMKSITECNLIIGFGGAFNGYYASLLSMKLDVPFLLIFRGTDINMSKWNLSDNEYNKVAISSAQHIVCLSEEMKFNISLTMPKAIKRVTVIPNIIKFGIIKSTFTNYPISLVIGTSAAHLNEKKGVSNLLYMLGKLKEILEVSLRFDFIGAIDEDVLCHYQEICSELNITNNVRFLGYRNREDSYNIINGWDIYIQGSVCEGFGNSVAECISMGKVVFLSHSGFIAESLFKNFPECVFDIWEPASIATRLVDLLKVPNLLSKFKKAYTALQQQASRECIIVKWKNILNLMKVKPIVVSPILPSGILSVVLHDVQGEVHDNITTPVSVLRKFIHDLHSYGFGVCSMKNYLQKDSIERRKWVVCTFDDGYVGILDNALPILQQYGYSATVFVCTATIGIDNSWNYKDTKVRQHLNMNQLHTLHDAGWEIASHGVTHRSMLRLTDEELIIELNESKRILETEFGVVDTYAYPYGAYNEYIKNQVCKHYKYAFLLTQGSTHLAVDAQQIRRYYISEFYKIIKK